MSLIKSPSSTRLLSRILSDPGLPEKIRSLEPKALTAMINQIGLEDSGEIVALATTEQIERVFDEDLWRASKPGSDEHFDASRFGLWLEILLELSAASAAQKITEIDSDFITMAISQLIWVVDFPSLRLEVSSQTHLEKIMDSTHFIEIEDFVIFSRDPRTWDAVVTLVTELDHSQHGFLRTILENCAHLTTERIEDEGGLYSILTAEEQLKDDVAYEREKRREAEGFVTPAEARAFLKLASGGIETEDHVSPKKFRSPHLSPSTGRQELKISGQGRFEKVQELLSADPSRRVLQMEELNYLANVLVSGWQISGRSPRPGEAALLALETCERGLRSHTETRSLIEAFRRGWILRK